jgi:hypothetical protein
MGRGAGGPDGEGRAALGLCRRVWVAGHLLRDCSTHGGPARIDFEYKERNLVDFTWGDNFSLERPRKRLQH